MSPEHDIDGKPHYFKNDQFPRHFYFFGTSSSGSPVNRWVLGKTCNVDVMGAVAFCRQNAGIIVLSLFIVYINGLQ